MSHHQLCSATRVTSTTQEDGSSTTSVSFFQAIVLCCAALRCASVPAHQWLCQLIAAHIEWNFKRMYVNRRKHNEVRDGRGLQLAGFL